MNNKLLSITSKAAQGLKVWNEIKNKHQISHRDLIYFLELEDDLLCDITTNILKEYSYDFDDVKVYIIIKSDKQYMCTAPNIEIIVLDQSCYFNLRTYCLVTNFNPLIRFISDKEPFGDLQMMTDKRIDKIEYIKKSILKVN